MSWERFRCITDCENDPDNCISENLYKQHAEILGQKEWKEAGYLHINIDDCWSEKNRTEDGKLREDSVRFPSGMKALADYVHSQGLKFGTYNDMGTKTCGGYPGECKDEACTLPGYMNIDAETYAGWGVDMLKMDGCNSVHNDSVLNPAYIFLGEALNKTQRPFLYSCSWPDYIRLANLEVNYTLTAEKCNMWRMYDDIQDSWDSVTNIIDWVGDNAGKGSDMQTVAGPGNWNDPDHAYHR